MRGKGYICKKCYEIAKTKTQEQFIKDLKALDPTIQVLGKYVNSRTRIEVRCIIDNHTWEQEPNYLLRGRGCIVCNKRKRQSRIKKKNHQEEL